jgi:hypothetical protein
MTLRPPAPEKHASTDARQGVSRLDDRARRRVNRAHLGDHVGPCVPASQNWVEAGDDGFQAVAIVSLREAADVVLDLHETLSAWPRLVAFEVVAEEVESSWTAHVHHTGLLGSSRLPRSRSRTPPGERKRPGAGGGVERASVRGCEAASAVANWGSRFGAGGRGRNVRGAGYFFFASAAPFFASTTPFTGAATVFATTTLKNLSTAPASFSRSI